MNQKQQLEQDIKALEAKLNEMKATVEAMPSEAPARWVPKADEDYLILTDLVTICPRRNLTGYTTERQASVGNVHRTKEDAENYRLRLESFVPALGPETPSDEVLKSGWAVDKLRDAAWPMSEYSPKCYALNYQQGTWHPTREEAEEWLAKYGKVRGYKL